MCISDLVDFISRDEPDVLQAQSIENAGISHARCSLKHFKHHHRILWLMSNQMSV